MLIDFQNTFTTKKAIKLPTGFTLYFPAHLKQLHA